MRIIVFKIIVCSLILNVFELADLCSQVSVSNGLVAYYNLNGNADNSLSNAKQGVLHNVTFVEDRHGNANSSAFFNGTDHYIEIKDKVLNDTDSAFTITLWFKINIQHAYKYPMCLISNVENDSVIKFEIMHAVELLGTMNGTAYFRLNHFNRPYTPLAVGGISNYTKEYNPDAWHFASFRIQYTPTKLISTTTVDSYYRKTIFTADSCSSTADSTEIRWKRLYQTFPERYWKFSPNFKLSKVVTTYIGKTISTVHNYSIDPNNIGRYFFGNLDEIRIYNRYLSNAEVSTLKNGESENGINTAEKLNVKYKILPNPSSNCIYVEGLDVLNSFEILNLTGTSFGVSNTNPVNISELRKGMYIIRFQNKAGKVFALKFNKL